MKKTMEDLIRRGNLNECRMVFNNCSAKEVHSALILALKYGKLNIIKYLHELGGSFNEYMTGQVCDCSDISIAAYLFSHVKITEFTIKTVIMAGRLDILKHIQQMYPDAPIEHLDLLRCAIYQTPQTTSFEELWQQRVIDSCELLYTAVDADNLDILNKLLEEYDFDEETLSGALFDAFNISASRNIVCVLVEKLHRELSRA